jgi:hypothetical protein
MPRGMTAEEITAPARPTYNQISVAGRREDAVWLPTKKQGDLIERDNVGARRRARIVDYTTGKPTPLLRWRLHPT